MHISVEGLQIYVTEAGSVAEPALLLLHGWPESSAAFSQVMELVGEEHRVVAMNLPGISANRRRDVTLVGHDVGGQIVYAYLHAYPYDLRAAVIMNVAVPGVEPWSEVIRNPYIWHFGFHAVPNLPELLVQGHQAEYFGYFYDTIAARPGAVHPRARQIYVEAYARPEALRTGFEWYRALCSIFAAERNRGSSWSAM